MTIATDLYDWLVFVHVLAAMVWLGGITLLGALAIGVLRDREGEEVGRFLARLRRIGPLVLAPAPVLLLAFGIWAVADSDAWDFGQLWVQLALGLFAGAFLIGAAHQSTAAIGAERAAARGDRDGAVRRLRRWSFGMAAIILLLVVATWAMVFKPGL
jgi:uncharacterized membrane protein